MVRAFLLTFMTRQFFLHQQAVKEKYPHAWFVWEPGNWKAPAYNEETIVPRKVGREGEVDPTQALPRADALCFALRSEGQPLTVGRLPTSSMVINDGTVSRQHLSLRQDVHGQWTAERITKTKPTSHRGVAFPPSGAVLLHNGDTLSLGDIHLTFYDAAGFVRRLEEEVRRQLSRPTGTGG